MAHRSIALVQLTERHIHHRSTHTLRKVNSFLLRNDNQLRAGIDNNQRCQRRYDALARALQEMRDQGFALDRKEHERGVCCVAVLMSSLPGESPASLSVSGPTSRYTPARLRALAPTLTEAARAIGRTDTAPSRVAAMRAANAR